jgi:hypothetical protein
MTHADHPAGSTRKTFASPPLWLRLAGAPLAVLVALGMTDKRGVAMGVFAGVVYGLLAAGLLAWDRTVSWSRRHPFLDSLIGTPVAFVAIAYVTSLSLIASAAIALGVTPLLVGVAYLKRRGRENSEADSA